MIVTIVTSVLLTIFLFFVTSLYLTNMLYARSQKMYIIWKLHVWIPFKVLSFSTHTLIPMAFPILETVLVHFFCDGFQLLRRIFLNLWNRLKSASFEGFVKFWEQEKVTKSKVRWVGGRGRKEQRSSVWLQTHEFWVLSGLERRRDRKNQLSLLHSSGLLRRTASLRCYSTSM